MSYIDVGGEGENTMLLTIASADEPNVDTAAENDVIVTRMLSPVLVAVALFVTAIAMTVPARPKLILAAAGDVTSASYFTGVVDAMTAGVELFTNPVLGSLSDVIGRRPVLMISQFGELSALLIIAQFNQHLWSYLIAYLSTSHGSDLGLCLGHSASPLRGDVLSHACLDVAQVN